MNKKIMYSILILLSFCFIDNVEAKSYTINTDLFGDVVVDTDVLEQENDLYLVNDTFIVAKRNNGTDLVLITFNNDGSNKDRICEQYGYTGTKIRYTCGLHLFLYDNENKNWIVYSNVYQFSVNNGNFYYMTFKYLNPIASDSWTVDYSKHYLLQYGYLNLYDGEYTENPIPTISIRKSNENKITLNGVDYITDITLYTEFSSIDNDKYFYLYKYGSSSEWSQIILEQSNSFSKTFSTNDTFYVQVLDKTTQETVSSATYTVDTIEQLPEDYIEDELIEDTMNTSSGSKDVIFHDCNVNLEVGYVLCKVEINNYDNSLYNYYYRIGNDSFILFRPDEKTQILPEIYDDSLLLKNNDDISLYKKWESASDNINTYLLSLKIFKNTTIYIARENKETGERQYYTFTIDSLVDSNDMSQIEEFLYNHLLSKFYFVYQFKDIIEYVSSYDFEENAKAPQFSFDLSFIGLQTVVVDMKINESLRLLIHGYIKLFASLLVIHTFIKETTKLFNK